MGTCSAKIPKELSYHSDESDENSELFEFERTCEETEDCKSFETCFHLLRLTTAMKKYNCKNADNITVLQVLNDYLHFLSKHHEHADFEYIYNRLGYCDIAKCNKFNHRVSSKNANITILNKIHCYFQHCYDIGNRLSAKEADELHSDQKHDEETFLISKRIIKLRRILCKKRAKIAECTAVNQRLNLKYNQLCSHSDEETAKSYHFGYRFKYGYEGEGHHTDEYMIKSIEILQKFQTFKEEIINNDTSVLAVEQFNNEYKKAQIHFGSWYCKEQFQPFTQNDRPAWQNMNVDWTFEIEYLLALMLYSNYTQFQYELSKTYREDKGKQHNNFYHMGKYLKIAVSKFGTKINHGDIQSFYHGITEKLIFQSYGTVEILSPLSTSSSFAVALNFSNNDGLVVQFGIYNDTCSIRYFSMAWLSDYGSESEYLFVQPTDSLAIDNVFDPGNGCHYDYLMKALGNIQDMFGRGIWSDHIKPEPVDPNMKKLMTKIVHHRLSSLNMKCYESFSGLHSYGEKMIQVVLETNKIGVWMDYDLIKDVNIGFLFALLLKTERPSIQFARIEILFPYVKAITIFNFNNTALELDNIYNYLNDNKGKTKLKQVELISKKIVFDVNNLGLMQKTKYAKKFKEINFNIGVDEDRWKEYYSVSLRIIHDDKLRSHKWLYWGFNLNDSNI